MFAFEDDFLPEISYLSGDWVSVKYFYAKEKFLNI
jgi:hypothetical protein